jgi:hypothetical protein
MTALQKRTALNALYLEVEPSIANDIVDLANATITEAEAYARAAGEQARNLFWPPKDEFEEHIYEIRNGKVADYVKAHALALAGTFAGVGKSTTDKIEEAAQEISDLTNYTGPSAGMIEQVLKKHFGAGESPAAAPQHETLPVDQLEAVLYVVEELSPSCQVWTPVQFGSFVGEQETEALALLEQFVATYPMRQFRVARYLRDDQ